MIDPASPYATAVSRSAVPSLSMTFMHGPRFAGVPLSDEIYALPPGE